MVALPFIKNPEDNLTFKIYFSNNGMNFFGVHYKIFYPLLSISKFSFPK